MSFIKPEPDVKSEPEGLSPGLYMDDDLADTGELAVPAVRPSELWLARLPRWLWGALAAAGDDDDPDAEIEIGKVALFRDPKTGRVADKRPLHLFLNEQWHQKAQLPRAYELPVAAPALTNTYAFTEKDIPGHKPPALGQQMPDLGGKKSAHDSKFKIQKMQLKQRRTIPKNTALVGGLNREYGCVPIKNAEYRAWESRRTHKAIQGENKATNVTTTKGNSATMEAANRAFRNFNTAAGAAAASGARRQDNKAARIPKNELIDLLHNCFDQYTFWSMRALRTRTQQPEAYLKEVLQDIAALVKSGQYASNWRRRAEFDNDAVKAVNGLPPDDDAADEDAPADDDDDDDNLEMEDVV